MTNYEILKEYEEHKTPVTSYEELEQLQNWADFTNDYHELREKLEIAEYKNAELKECLKNCRELFDTWDYPNIVKEIDEALK